MSLRRPAHILLLLVNMAVLVLLLASGPTIHPDTASYADHSLSRGPLLPLLIDLSRVLAGPHAYQLLAGFQVLFITLCLAWFAAALHRFFGSSRLAAHIAFTFLQGMLLKFGNAILSEPLSFGLHALFMGALLGHVFTRRSRYAVGMLGVAGLELLLRPQLFYVFVFLLCYAGFLLLRERGRRNLLLLAAVPLLWGALFLLRSGYNEMEHGVFGQYSAIGEHLLATQLYIAAPGDQEILTAAADRAFVGELLRRIDEQKASIHHWDQSKSHYNKSIERIYFQNLMPVYEDMRPGRSDIERDGDCKRLGLVLLKAHPARYARLLFLKVYYGPFNYLCMGLVLLGLSLAWYARTGSRHAFVYLSASGLSLFNYGMLIPFALIVKRYTLVSDAYQILFTALCGLLLLGMARPETSSKDQGRG